MPAHALSDDMLQQAVEAFSKYGSQVAAAQALGIPRPTLQHRLREADRRAMAVIPRILDTEYPGRLTIDVEDGRVLIASDAHYWPGVVTTMHKAFVRACKEMTPRAVIMNGDVNDGARTGRHAPIMWEEAPTVAQEGEACKERLGEIEDAAPDADKLWSLGNHDARFESRLAAVAPEYANVHGMHLKDHFPKWAPCWSVWINDDVVVKHRFKGGLHAAHNNTVTAGKTIVTGHLHSAKVTPWTDYNGTRWGVDSGTLCEAPWVQAINYLEDNPVNWRSAFVVLTFHKGRLLQPELCLQHAPGQVEWRGKVWDV